MYICLIRNEYYNKDIGYLFYRESDKSFSIELDKNSKRYFPALLSLMADKGIYTVDPYWSNRFVSARVIPIDRQNISDILKNEGLKEYDVYRLLVSAEGRCSHDDCAIIPISKDHILPKWLHERLNDKIKSVTISENNRIYIELINGKKYSNNLNNIFANNKSLSILLNRKADLLNYSLMINGSGLYWYNQTYIMIDDLLNNAETLNLEEDFMYSYISQNIISTLDACKILNCTRQYINQLVKTGRLYPVMEVGNNRFFLKSDVFKTLN